MYAFVDMLFLLSLDFCLTGAEGGTGQVRILRQIRGAPILLQPPTTLIIPLIVWN